MPSASSAGPDRGQADEQEHDHTSTAAAISSASDRSQWYRVVIVPAAAPPRTPRARGWPRLTCPAQPVSTTSDTATIE